MTASRDPQPSAPEARIKVLHILHSLARGGMENRVARLARGLDPARFEIKLLTFRVEGIHSIALPNDVEHKFLAIPPGLHPGRLLALWKFIRGQRFDIVHTHNWGSMFYGLLAAKLAGTRLVIHGEHGQEIEDHISPKRLWAQRGLVRLADLVVSVNQPIASHVRRAWKLRKDKVLTIPNGVDLARFRVSGARPGAPFVFGTVTRFSPVKNLPCLVDAFARLVAKVGRDAVRLVVVGSGADLAAVRAQCREAGLADLVQFPGDTDRPEDFYGGFSVFVNTSLYEGMSNTILEAMACGVPVIASAVEGNREWLTDGVDALFFASNDAADLALKMERYLRDPGLTAKIGAHGRARVEREFDNRDFISKYRAMYDSLLGGSRR